MEITQRFHLRIHALPPLREEQERRKHGEPQLARGSRLIVNCVLETAAAFEQ